jgi:uncharacterized membrane protein YqiK
MSYRDDRDALREHAEALEQELSAAREEIERLRRSGDERQLEPLAPSGGGVAAMMAGLLVLVSLTAPLPRAVRQAGVAIGLSLLATLLVLARLLVFARENELLLVSGRTLHKLRAARTLRIPLVQEISRLDLGLFRVALSLRGARTRDGSSIDVALVAHVRASPEQPALDRAIERLQGMPLDRRSELVATALEPCARRVLAAHDQRGIDAGRADAAAAIRDAARPDLESLGVVLIGLYLPSIQAEGARQ